MSVIIKVKRGTEKSILEGTLQPGELAFSTDSSTLFGFNGIYKSIIGRAVVDTVDNISTYSGSVGRLFYGSDNEHFYVHDGNDWVDITVSGGEPLTLSGTGGIETNYDDGIWFIDGSNIPISNNVWGYGYFSANGTSIYHGLGSMSHVTVVIPEDTSDYDRRDVASVGEIYVKVGENEDIIYNTGGPRSWDFPFRWFATLSGSGDDYVSQSEMEELILTTSGDIVSQIPVVSSGNLMGNGVFSLSGTTITHNLGDLDHYVSVTPAGSSIFNKRTVAAIGEIFVEKGTNQDTVWITGGPRAEGMGFDWEVVRYGLRMVEGV